MRERRKRSGKGRRGNHQANRRLGRYIERTTSKRETDDLEKALIIFVIPTRQSSLI